ncbi:hypothetical protein M422DRAFT_268296 [Sphaerobolus stellatus SS14]|uniref:DDE Tnp4 domain-containing protein n=1 Tax=Sphaerobolus stellatus (strain SS14) TaxID=990650 RepID=A0A0C9UYL5_SPHS4|nr:hypothetical protein M422DRAFT_268296 [Sphaerobolus stellatus SS14]
METFILECQMAFNKLLEQVFHDLDQQFIEQQGSTRPGGKVDLYELGDTVWKDQFRFTKYEVFQLVEALKMPEYIKCETSGIKEDNVTALYGMIIHVYGPVDGRRHDETVYKESGLFNLLDKHFWTPEGQPLYVYGNPAYSASAHIMPPFKGPVITPEQQTFNAAMSKIMEPVEWIFKEVTQQFSFLDFSHSQKILLSPCGLFYLVSLLLCNAHTILHSPQIPQYFDCAPPSLQECFSGGPIDDEDLDCWCLDSFEEPDNRDDEEGSDEVIDKT